jgi:hypothetical protein
MTLGYMRALQHCAPNEKCEYIFRYIRIARPTAPLHDQDYPADLSPGDRGRSADGFLVRNGGLEVVT